MFEYKSYLILAATAAFLLLPGTAMGEQRTVTVSGQGEVSAQPDSALVTLGVEARGSEQKTTQREVETVVRNFISACNALGIEERHVKTAQLNIRPEYDWNKSTSKRRLTGYYVHRTLEVNVKDLSKLGTLLEDATNLGVNQASTPQLLSSKKDELLREALSKAAQNARLNASAVATTLDAKLGKVRNISTTNVSFRPPQGARMMAAGVASRESKSSGADTFATGEIKYSADVTVEFDLLVE